MYSLCNKHHELAQTFPPDFDGYYSSINFFEVVHAAFFDFISLQPIKTRDELDTSTVLIIETNRLRVSPVNFHFKILSEARRNIVRGGARRTSPLSLTMVKVRSSARQTISLKIIQWSTSDFVILM